LSALTFLVEDCDFEETYNYIDIRRFKCYENNFIISYSRPFTSSRGDLPNKMTFEDIVIKLDASSVATEEENAFLTPDEKSYHDRIIQGAGPDNQEKVMWVTCAKAD
jgi:hypothetical protein